MEYTCSRCDMKGGRMQFQKTNLQRDVARHTQQCVECKEGKGGGQKCTIRKCWKFVPENNLSRNCKRLQKQWKAYVCQACSLHGENALARTQIPGDKTEYECSRCNHRGHRLEFQKKTGSEIKREAPSNV